MDSAFVSLLWIVLVAVAAPLIAWTIPRRLVPETVLLIVGGMVIGPHMLGWAHDYASIHFLQELGMAFLFLLAGYEIDVNELRGSGGRHALVAWCGSLFLAFATVSIVGVSGGTFSANGIAIAIAMTSTAIGTILPILRERGLLPTAVGASILNHGAIGEVGPIILMALLLGARSTWTSLAILILFGVITLWIVRATDQVKRAGLRVVEIIHLGGSTTAQTTIRITVLLLVGLCTLAEVFDLDVVLGAFAAGFILRHALPEGNHEFEQKLDGLAYGFFIPLFFVSSGMSVEMVFDLHSLINLGGFLVLLVLTRGLPVWVAASAERKRDGSRAFSQRQALQIGVYSTTALPIIVAVTQVAVNAGVMSSTFASTLVLSGVVSVMVMPALGLLLSAPEDQAPAIEAMAVAQGPVTHDGQGPEAEAQPDAHEDGVAVSEPRPPASSQGAGATASGGGDAEHAGTTGNDGDGESARRSSGLGARPAVPAGAGSDSRSAAAGNATSAAGRTGMQAGGISGARAAAQQGSASATSAVPAATVRGASLGAPGSGAEGSAPRARLLGHDRSFHHHGLSPQEARRLAERLAQLEAERQTWREHMRRQLPHTTKRRKQR